MSSYGLPGPGGSLGKCGYCGKSFITETILGRNVRTVRLGGCEIALHEPECFDKLVGLASDGGITFDKWRQLPEESPLRNEMQRLEREELAKESHRA